MSTRLMSLGGIVLLVVLFLGLNIWLGRVTRAARVDLTQQKLYTLSKGSRNIARSFDEPVKLVLYYSSRLAQGRPQVQSYGTRVRELLEEYANASGGKIDLRVVDPQPFTEDEDAAVQGGLSGVPVGPNETLYFGLVGTNAVDTREVIPFFDPSAERFLEYDVSRLLYSLANPKKKTIGVLSGLSMEGFRMNPATGQPQQTPPWAILRELRGIFTVKTLQAQNPEITPDLDALLLVHPKGLPPSTLYAIDQYVLKGGKLLALVDPLCESDQSGADPRNPMAAMMADRSSDKVLQPLFNAWGVKVEPGKIAADLTYAPQVMTNDPSRPEPVSYVAWLDLPAKAFDRQDATTGMLSRVIMASAGFITPGAVEAPKPAAPETPKDETIDPVTGEKTTEKAGEEKPAPAPATPAAPVATSQGSRVVIKPLIRTSSKAMKLDQASVAFMPDPKALLNNYVPGNEELVLAARLELAPGASVPTAFPDGKPVDPPNPNAPAPPPAADAKEGLVTQSTGALNVVIVTDSDFLQDRFWVQEERFGQLSLGARKIADNGDFVVNLLDNLCGSSDLMAIRARGEFARPFTRVQEIQKQAEQTYRAEEQALQDKLRQAQTKIDELQRASPGKEGAGGLIISEEQRREIDKFRDEVVSTRKQLRLVQANLRRDINSLDNRLTFINTALVPILVTLAAVGLGAYRVSRRRAGAAVEPAAAKGAGA